MISKCNIFLVYTIWSDVEIWLSRVTPTWYVRTRRYVYKHIWETHITIKMIRIKSQQIWHWISIDLQNFIGHSHLTFNSENFENILIQKRDSTNDPISFSHPPEMMVWSQGMHVHKNVFHHKILNHFTHFSGNTRYNNLKCFWCMKHQSL